MYDLLAAKKNAADSEDNPETISWQALGNETENVLGQRIDDANKFGTLYDANPAFKELCSFGPEGVKLNTSSAEARTTRGGTDTTVEKAAKRATAKRQG